MIDRSTLFGKSRVVGKPYGIFFFVSDVGDVSDVFLSYVSCGFTNLRFDRF